jgi:nucleotide-binding universal stress UspA family protein
MKILLAVDGSKNSLVAVNSMIEHAGWYRSKPTVELVTVHLPLPKLPNMRLVVSKAQIQRYYDEEGQKALAAAKKKLDAAGIRYQAGVLVGAIAESIVKQAKSARCDLICIGTRGMSNVAKVLVGSTATKLLQLSDIPVLLVK